MKGDEPKYLKHERDLIGVESPINNLTDEEQEVIAMQGTHVYLLSQTHY